MKLKKLIKIIRENKYNLKDILIILLMSIFISIPLLIKNIDITYDDGIQHICRIIGTMQTITGNNEKFPVIISNLCNNFGYSWNLFYSPLTAYVPLIFKIFNVSYITCLKLFMFFSVFLSGITMYFFTKEISKNNKVALLSAIFYIFAPYRLTDMYLRVALSELVSFVFLPMVFQGLYGILKNKKNREYILIFGTIGMILTHTVITLYTAIIALIYIITQIKKLKNKSVIKKLVISSFFIVLITSSFWLPLLEHKVSVNYEVFKPGRMERTDVMTALKLELLELFYTPKQNIRIYEIGFISFISLILTPFVVKKLGKKHGNTDMFRFYIFSFMIGILCCFMTLKIFPFEKMPAFLKMIQFTFRLLEFSSFFFAFVVSVNINTLIKRMKYKDIGIISVLLIILTCTYISHLHYKENINEEILYDGIPVTENTGRVHAGCASFEYLPTRAFENRKYIEDRDDKIIVLDFNNESKIQIENENKNGTEYNCDLIYVTEDTKIELPYIYYLGYRVVLDDGEKTHVLKTYETDNGFVGVIIPAVENAKLKVNYEGTTLMKISKGISTISLISLIGYTIFYKYYKNKCNDKSVN